MDKSYHYNNGPIPSIKELLKLKEQVDAGNTEAMEEVDRLRFSMRPAATVPEKEQVHMVMDIYAKAKEILNSRGL